MQMMLCHNTQFLMKKEHDGAHVLNLLQQMRLLVNPPDDKTSHPVKS